MQSQQKLLDSISEAAWKLPSYLFPIYSRFHVNNGDITIALAAKQAPRSDW